METAERKTNFGLTALNSELHHTSKDRVKVIKENIEQGVRILKEVAKEAGFKIHEVWEDPLQLQIILDTKDKVKILLCTEPEEIWDGPSDGAMVVAEEQMGRVLHDDLKGPTDLKEALEDIKHRSDEYGVDVNPILIK